MAKTLTNFTITAAGDDYVLHIEDDAGETIEFTATYDQLDLLVEEIDKHLDEDAEEMDEVDGCDGRDPAAATPPRAGTGGFPGGRLPPGRDEWSFCGDRAIKFHSSRSMVGMAEIFRFSSLPVYRSAGR